MEPSYSLQTISEAAQLTAAAGSGVTSRSRHNSEDEQQCVCREKLAKTRLYDGKPAPLRWAWRATRQTESAFSGSAVLRVELVLVSWEPETYFSDS